MEEEHSTPKLDREIVLQTLRGYAEVNRITESERRARLKTVSIKESLTSFADLYKAWSKMGRVAGGNLERIQQSHFEDQIRLRRAFEILAREKGYIR